MRMTKAIEEANKDVKFSRGDFYTVEDVKQFLMEQGYAWTKSFGENRGDHEVAFNDCGKYNKYIDDQYILIGTEDDWGDSVDEYYVCEDITKCPYVKYIRQPSLTEFKVYKPIEHPHVGEPGFGNTYIDYELEKDLSIEWVKFLVKLCPEFGDYLLKNCDTLIWQEKGHMETETRFIAKKIEELEQQDKESKANYNNKVRHYKNVIDAVKQTKNDLQV
ncbi:MAG: hypothetical protein IJA72_03830 [Clostridia bacterium]|nr:hypothetical protein [Clostridia bacterium]